jgi:hypothetical protein
MQHSVGSLVGDFQQPQAARSDNSNVTMDEAGTDDPNPYAPPSARPRRTRPLVSPWFKWAYLASSTLFWAAPLASGVAASLGVRLEVAALAAPPLAMSLFVAYATGNVCALIWIHRVWARVPDRHRVGWGSGHARVTPANAVGYLFIPGFNFHWAFAMPSALCSSIDAISPKGRAVRARWWGRIAASCNVTLILFVFAQELPLLVALSGLLAFVIAPVLWFAFMMQIERALKRLPRQRKRRDAA